jgi:uncharacterized membrane protein (GlpM family)
MELLFRFVIGGVIVSLFAALGSALKPKSFAGIFSAAPSVALATLGLTVLKDGKPYASLESRSMIVGALSLLLYSALCGYLLRKYKIHAATASIPGLALWLLCALGAWAVLLR